MFEGEAVADKPRWGLRRKRTRVTKKKGFILPTNQGRPGPLRGGVSQSFTKEKCVPPEKKKKEKTAGGGKNKKKTLRGGGGSRRCWALTEKEHVFVTIL